MLGQDARDLGRKSQGLVPREAQLFPLEEPQSPEIGAQIDGIGAHPATVVTRIEIHEMGQGGDGQVPSRCRSDAEKPAQCRLIRIVRDDGRGAGIGTRDEAFQGREFPLRMSRAEKPRHHQGQRLWAHSRRDCGERNRSARAAGSGAGDGS